MHTEQYDVLVIGGGHAGCEAALATSRLGLKTLMLTTNLDNIAYLACNPSIGGTAKGHIVREIDALGGEMGINADKTLLQMRMLNIGKGVAVHSLRAQADKHAYHTQMKQTLESQENLRIYQGEAVKILENGGVATGALLATGITVSARAVIACCGVYLKADIIMGEYRKNIGPSGFAPANGLTESLLDLGLEIRRFKTGTPARVHKNSIDFTKMERQDGESFAYPFSFLSKEIRYNKEPCYLTYTTQETKDIIRQNIHRAPMFSGAIKGIGPRYCPSIEDKVTRFADKERHQIFIEPEGENTNEMYVQGMSTSMPIDVQEEMYRSVIGLENVQILRHAYAIEYDAINPLQLDATLRYKNMHGLYFAGQINGSSGYEEAGGQGLIAGINAACYLQGKEPLILKRSDAYIGVLIDDLVTKGTNEPYRMMTSRAEYRLHIRQDNADQRLTEMGRKVGLVTDLRYSTYEQKMLSLENLKAELTRSFSPQKTAPVLQAIGEQPLASGIKLCDLLKRTGVTADMLFENFEFEREYSKEVREQAEIELKYDGYIKKQHQEIEKAEKLENRMMPNNFNYADIKGLRIEAVQKLNKIQPLTLGQASRISGVSPADISVLIIALAN